MRVFLTRGHYYWLVMCFRCLWNYPVNWASCKPDPVLRPHSRSQEAHGGDLTSYVPYTNIKICQLPCHTLIGLLVPNLASQVSLPPIHLAPTAARVIPPWAPSKPVLNLTSLFSSLSAVAVDTGPPSVCQVSRTAARCDPCVSSWIWRVPHQRPHPAQTASDSQK